MFFHIFRMILRIYLMFSSLVFYLLGFIAVCFSLKILRGQLILSTAQFRVEFAMKNLFKFLHPHFLFEFYGNNAVMTE